MKYSIRRSGVYKFNMEQNKKGINKAARKIIS
jgi:hypothetical protein